ncbi:MAG: S8 family serine peptidase [Candidatus Zixiibacteriota bacterium]
MKMRIVIIFVALLIAEMGFGQAEFQISTKVEKISPQIYKMFGDNGGEAIKVWVFFTDKEIYDNGAFKSALDNLHSEFSARSIERRAKRTRNSDLFGLADVPVSQTYIQRLEASGAEIKRVSRWLNAVSAEVDEAVIADIAKLPFVAEISPVGKMIRRPVDDEAELIPQEGGTFKGVPGTADFYGETYTQLELINIPKMHRIGLTGEGILIAIFDSGFDLTHPVFDSLNLVADSSFISLAEIDTDHGTKVLSAIVGFIDSLFVGGAYGADVLLAATEIDGTTEIAAEEDNWVAAAEWADLMGADIISSSLGYIDWYDYSDLDGQTAVITIAAEQAIANGIVVVNSAGNEALHSWYYITPPADGENVIAVGAIDSTGQIANFSSNGPTYDGRIKPDVVAMGVGVYTALAEGTFVRSNGTSFAAPLTASAIALILEAQTEWTPLELKQSLLESADRYDNPTNRYGYGLYDTYIAAQLLKFDSIPSYIMRFGDTLNIDISLASPIDSLVENASILASGLPISADFVDLGNGAANLFYVPTANDIGQDYIIGLSGTSGLEINTYTELEIHIAPDDNLTFGPNPFTDSITIYLGANNLAGDVNFEEISIYSVNGDKVCEISSDNFNSITGSIVWHGVNNNGTKIASGVYLIYVNTSVAEYRLKVFKK